MITLYSTSSVDRASVVDAALLDAGLTADLATDQACVSRGPRTRRRNPD